MNRRRAVALHALTAPGASTNLFTAFTPEHQGAVLEIEISLAVASIVDLQVSNTAGSPTAYSQALFDGATLTAGTRYTCSVAAPKTTTAGTAQTMTYSLRVRTDGIIQSCIVDEVTDR